MPYPLDDETIRIPNRTRICSLLIRSQLHYPIMLRERLKLEEPKIGLEINELPVGFEPTVSVKFLITNQAQSTSYAKEALKIIAGMRNYDILTYCLTDNCSAFELQSHLVATVGLEPTYTNYLVNACV